MPPSKKKQVEPPPKPPRSKTFRTSLSIRAKYKVLIDLLKSVQDPGDKSTLICELMMDGLRFRELGNTGEQKGPDGFIQNSTPANLLVHNGEAVGEDADDLLEDDLDEALFETT